MTALATDWRTWPPEQRAAFLERLRSRRYDQRRAAWHPYPWQTPPSAPVAHGMWLLLGGRGTGKTDGSARYTDDHMMGPPCDKRIRGGHRAAIIAPTLGDAAESCVLGPSGLQAHNPGVQLKATMGGTKVVWPNGAEARLFGAYSKEDVERLRAGGNRCLVWLEEAAAMRHLAAALEHTAYGLRIGATPHYVASTTPKPRVEIRTLLADPTTIVTRGRTQDATHLAQAVRDKLYKKYLGTRLGQQELEGLLLGDTEGALWTWKVIERLRVLHTPPLHKVIVAIDPAASNTEASDETGIIVAGLGVDGHGYTLDDLSGRYDPAEWGRIALEAAARWEAEYVVAEKNNGGDMVGHVLDTSGGRGRYRLVNASKGKRVRAEPVSVLYERGMWHHVGAFPELEEQLTTWVPPQPGETDTDSPDRLDALVWAATDLLVSPQRGGAVSAA